MPDGVALPHKHGIQANTLYNWHMKAQQRGNAEQWPSKEKFLVALESAMLNGTERQRIRELKKLRC